MLWSEDLDAFLEELDVCTVESIVVSKHCTVLPQRVEEEEQKQKKQDHVGRTEPSTLIQPKIPSFCAKKKVTRVKKDKREREDKEARVKKDKSKESDKSKRVKKVARVKKETSKGSDESKEEKAAGVKGKGVKKVKLKRQEG